MVRRPVQPLRGLSAESETLCGVPTGEHSGLPKVLAVSVSPRHTLHKLNQLTVRLVPGEGVEGDAHAGPTVKHRSRLVKTPGAPNLRQVHLIHSELHDELRGLGYSVGPGDMGENITTRGIDLLSLPAGTRLKLGDTAIIELTGLRNPCTQLDSIGPGLMRATLARDAQGRLVRKAGVMSIVRVGGEVRPNDPILIERPTGPTRALEPV
jgi:MOSC domain-containing protein YiiM